MIQAKKRIDWIDMAKGYGMLLVILGHIGDFGEFSFIKIWFFSFHMPLFFFLSGYVFKDSYSFPSFLKKKARSIIIPYFCLGIPMILFQLLWDFKSGTLTSQSALKLIMDFLIQRRQWTIWFLACLLFLNLLFYLIKKVIKSDYLLAVISVVFTILGALYYYWGGKPLPWDIDICLMAFPFFFGGYFCKKKNLDAFFEKKPRVVILLFSSLLLNILVCYLNFRISGKWLNMFSSEYGCVPMTYIAAFAGIAFIIAVSKLGTLKLIRFIGENSILYLAWHETIMIPVTEKILIVGCSVLKISYDNLHILLHYAVILIMIVAILTLCALLISKTKLRFMIGKTNPKKTVDASSGETDHSLS